MFNKSQYNTCTLNNILNTFLKIIKPIANPYEYHINEDVYRTSWELQPYMALFGYIGTGEYLPSCSRVLWGSEIIEPDSGYNFRTGVTSVDLSENTQDFVEVHRLYYNGYKSNAGHTSSLI